MSLIQEFASYRGVVIEHGVGATKESSLPQFVAKLRALQKYDFDEKAWIDWTPREDCEITAYLVLFDKAGKPIFHVQDIQNVFEWDGASLSGLDELDLESAKVQFEVVANTYNGETKPKVARISKYDDVPGTGAVKKLDAAELAKMNTQYATALKTLSGGPKAASAKGGKTTTATTTAKGKAAAKTVVAPPPAPPAKTEEQATADAAATVPDPVPEKTAKLTPPPAPGKATPAAPPAPPKAKSVAAPPAAPVEKLTYEEAWTKCYEGKLPTVTDEQVATAFTGAMHRIASGQAEGEITGEDWGKIADTVLGECG